MGLMRYYGTDVVVNIGHEALDPVTVAHDHVRCQYHRGCVVPAVYRQWVAEMGALTCAMHQPVMLMRLSLDFQCQDIEALPPLPPYEPLGVRPEFVPLDVLPEGHARDVLVAKVAAHTAYIDLIEDGFPESGWRVDVLPDAYATLDDYLAAVAAWDGVSPIEQWHDYPLNEWAQGYR
ncbi:MAG: hypothetical protein H0X24_12100 [Ktedonobacterales bacterium]|nr:hypothetical protein [Ktedonobacterales bacterium]